MTWDVEKKAMEPIKLRLEDLEIRTFNHTPEGYCRVVGLWVDPINGKLIIQYDDEPIEGGES